MSTNFIARAPRIIGAYLTDHSKVAPVQKDQTFWVADGEKFLPVLNMFRLDERADLFLSDTSDPANDIETFNKKDVRYNLSASVIAKKRIDLSSGDLLMGAVRMVLNFMDQPVTMKTRSDIPKLFMPLHNEQLQEWRGRLLILSFHSFNLPQTIKELTGIANYFENLRLEKIQKGEGKETSTRMLEYLSRCWQSFKPEQAAGVVSNSIKLAMVHEYQPSDFMVSGTEVEDLFCSESGLSFRRTTNMLEVPVHPKHNDTLLANRQIVQSMRDNGISCFIVDNEKRLSERFINFVGSVRKIPQVVDYNRPEGLYITTVDGQKGLGADSYIPLAEIDNCRYIYKSHEEALDGTDVRQQAVQNHELSKLEMNVEAAQLQQQAIHMRHEFEQQTMRMKQSFDEQTRAAEIEAKRRQMEHDAYIRDMEARHQETLRNYKIQEEANKFNLNSEKFRFDLIGMENKHHYETAKYDRDTTIETLKTVGSVAGLLAGGYVLYKQLTKN